MQTRARLFLSTPVRWQEGRSLRIVPRLRFAVQHTLTISRASSGSLFALPLRMLVLITVLFALILVLFLAGLATASSPTSGTAGATDVSLLQPSAILDRLRAVWIAKSIPNSYSLAKLRNNGWTFNSTLLGTAILALLTYRLRRLWYRGLLAKENEGGVCAGIPHTRSTSN